jgi:hypothetical protein
MVEHMSTYDTPEIRRTSERCDRALEALNRAREPLDSSQQNFWRPSEIVEASESGATELFWPELQDDTYKPIAGEEQVSEAAREYYRALRRLRELEGAEEMRSYDEERREELQ